jgi:superfamily II DNA or RNA helicase
MKIVLRSLSFSVYPKTQEQKNLCVAHASQFISYKMEMLPGGIKVRTPDKFYGSRNITSEYFNFHINTFERFKEKVEHSSKYQCWDYTIEKLPMYEPIKVEYDFNTNYELRDYQEDIIKYAMKRLDPSVSYRNMILGIQPGKGKTLTAMYVAMKLGFSVCIIIKPSYIDKWVHDVQNLLGLSKKDFNVIKGGSSLRKLTKLAAKGKYKIPVTIISNKTYQGFITDFERTPDQFYQMGYKCNPFELMEKLKIGFLLRDEIHQDFHLNFKIDTYTHVYTAMALSATLVSNDRFMMDMYEVMFPSECRYDGGAYDRYVDIYPYYYHINSMKGIRTSFSGPGGFYAHNAFEMSIMRDKIKFKNYLDLINKSLKDSFFRNPREKKKAIIYCSTIEMCGFVAKYLKQLHPQLDIRRYVGEDPYENMIEPDIRVSTVGSGAVAFDIPDLVTVVMTQAIDSVQANLQSLGRLRRLSDNPKLEFIYFVCRTVQKHMDYDRNKKILFKDKAKTIQPLESGVYI